MPSEQGVEAPANPTMLPKPVAQWLLRTHNRWCRPWMVPALIFLAHAALLVTLLNQVSKVLSVSP